MARPTGGRTSRSEGGLQWFRALLLIAVLVVIGIFILARTASSSTGRTSTSAPHAAPTTTVTTVPSTTTTTTPLPASQVKVQVLNGLRTGSLAGQWTTKLKSQFGYQTGPADNATTTVTTSVIYVITPGYKAEAEQLAARIGLPPTAVSAAVPAPATAPIPAAERASSNLVLIIGHDLAGQA